MANVYQEFCKFSAQTASALRNTSIRLEGKKKE